MGKSKTKPNRIGRRRAPVRGVHRQAAIILDNAIADRAAVIKVARACKKDLSTVYRWIRGDAVPTVAMYERIAGALGIKDWRKLLPAQK